jgi:hypothetical protein
MMVLVAGCLAPTPAPSVTPAPGSLTLHIDSLNPGDPLPQVYSCTGSNESPEVSWENIPVGTKSLVLILEDPDAPRGTFTHWLVYNIPPESGELARGQPDANVLDDGAQQGNNSAGYPGYFPPCPPGGAQHRYIFHLYAVDMDILQPAADRASIDRALTGHTIGQTESLTTFRK